MAIAQKSATGNTGGTAVNPHTVTTSESPTPTAIGDLVVVLDFNDFYALSAMGTPVATGSPAMNAIPGATLDLGSSSGHIKGWYYYANTAGAQVISSTETGAHDEEKGLIAWVLGGAAASSPVDDATTTSGTAINPIASSVSPTTSDAYVLVATISISGNLSVGPYTTPSPLIEDAELSVDLDGVFAHAQLAASGATGTFTFTGNLSQPYGSVTIAIKTGGSTAAAPFQPPTFPDAQALRPGFATSVPPPLVGFMPWAKMPPLPEVADTPATTTVVSSRSSTWAVNQEVTSTRASTWSVFTPVPASTRSSTWAVNQAVVSTRASTWVVLATILSTRASTWRVLAAILSTRASTWAVKEAVVSTRASTWAVAATIVSTRASTWAVLATVVSTRASTWAVKAVVVSTRASTWDVLSLGTTIVSTRSSTWKVAATIVATRASTWAVKETVVATRASTWNVFTTTVSSRASTWSVLAAVVSTRASTWRVLAAIVSTRASTWKVGAIVVSTRATTWNVLTTVASTRSTTWSVLVAVVSTRSSTWRVLFAVVSTRSSTWAVASVLVVPVVDNPTAHIVVEGFSAHILGEPRAMIVGSHTRAHIETPR